ncbi:MAG: hypothetical protein F4X58_13370 [Chloroflexi bacterium]|nr:hypothetical protein [Chloroflexota bacterium]MYC02896.1 hypothetical protein [Chloroflexota bacterium]
MTITAEQVEAALAQAEPYPGYQPSALALLAERSNNELTAWGHEGCEVTLERVIPFDGDPRVLRWAFWCETCHVSQLALLTRPEAESELRMGEREVR